MRSFSANSLAVKMSSIFRKIMDLIPNHQPLYGAFSHFMRSEMFCLHINSLIENYSPEENHKNLKFILENNSSFLALLPSIDLSGISYRFSHSEQLRVILVSKEFSEGRTFHLREINAPNCNQEFVEVLLGCKNLFLKTLICSEVNDDLIKKIMEIKSLETLEICGSFEFFSFSLMPNLKKFKISDTRWRNQANKLKFDFKFFPSLIALDLFSQRKIVIFNETKRCVSLKKLTCSRGTYFLDDDSCENIEYLHTNEINGQFDRFKNLTSFYTTLIDDFSKIPTLMKNTLKTMDFTYLDDSLFDPSQFPSLENLCITFSVTNGIFGIKSPYKQLKNLEIRGYPTYDSVDFDISLPSNCCENLILAIYASAKKIIRVEQNWFSKSITVRTNCKTTDVTDCFRSDVEINIIGTTTLVAHNDNLKLISVKNTRNPDSISKIPIGVKSFESDNHYLVSNGEYQVLRRTVSGLTIDGNYYGRDGCTVTDSKIIDIGDHNKNIRILFLDCEFTETKEELEQRGFRKIVLKKCTFGKR